MTRPTHRALALVAALALGTSGCAYSMVRDGRFDQTRYQELVAGTTQATGTPLPDVETELIARREIPDVLRTALLEDWTPEELEAYEKGLVAIGLWPETHDLFETLLAVNSEEVAGFYVPSSRTLYVVTDLDVPFSVRLLSSLTGQDFAREIVLAHELVHAHQHGSHAALFDLVADLHDQDDLGSALSAAIEGDATHYGLVVTFDGLPLPEPETFLETEDEVASRKDGALAEAPALLRLTLAFPYSRGYVLSYAEGRALLDAPPASTEQVLHPAEGRAPFTVIDLAALTNALPPACRRLTENTVGELQLSVLFRDLGSETPQTAWRGWDGDRYLTAACGDRNELAWVTLWDSEADAAEFASAYEAVADAVAERGRLAAPLRIRREGSEVLVTTPAFDDVPHGAGRRARVSTVPELNEHFGRPERSSAPE